LQKSYFSLEHGMFYLYHPAMLRRRWLAPRIGAIAIFVTCGVPYLWLGSAQTVIEPDLKNSFAQQLSEGSNKLVLPADREQIVRLPAQKGTGYMWFPTAVDEKLKIVPIPGERIAGPPNKVGGFEDQYFSVRGLSSGSSAVTFEYKRPHSDVAAKTIRLNVIVQ
jgi:predicted secreted protein